MCQRSLSRGSDVRSGCLVGAFITFALSILIGLVLFVPIYIAEQRGHFLEETSAVVWALPLGFFILSIVPYGLGGAFNTAILTVVANRRHLTVQIGMLIGGGIAVVWGLPTYLILLALAVRDRTTHGWDIDWAALILSAAIAVVAGTWHGWWMTRHIQMARKRLAQETSA